jgi:ferritin-like metal-binding protein YciE
MDEQLGMGRTACLYLMSDSHRAESQLEKRQVATAARATVRGSSRLQPAIEHRLRRGHSRFVG